MIRRRELYPYRDWSDLIVVGLMNVVIAAILIKIFFWLAGV